ncbi:MAG: tetratricopeptide repeat protein [Pseudomonadota bacterium]
MAVPELIDRLIHNVTALIAEPVRASARQWREAELSASFSDLISGEREDQLADSEALIWEIWCDHDEEEAKGAMEAVIESIARRHLGRAERMSDVLVRDWPGWSEAWNKRATLYFLQGRDEESLADIQKVLELEPRHFGALCGFAQICMRVGDESSAAFGLERALALHPTLPGVKETLASIKPRVQRRAH